MTFRILVSTALFFLLLTAIPVNAEPPQFQNSADEIVEALTQNPPEALRTRGLTRGLTRSPGERPQYRTIIVKKREENHTLQETITVYPDQPEPKAKLKIEFDYDSYRIRPWSYGLLNKLGKALTSDELQGYSFYVNGHTDSDGPQCYNLDLSLNRAQAVKDFLVGNFNILPYRLTLRGYGEAMPLVPNTTAANKQMNRRVEIKLAN
jgi:outer membrane protein OmpA-like peptidoglycan-associated protein